MPALLLAGALQSFAASPATSLEVELDDVAPDRIERQRSAAVGALPLPGTPDLARLPERLADAGLRAGDEVFIRIFKAESELELWMRRGDRFVLFATYPICHWSGTLGPKVEEGDKQNPEGFYSIAAHQLHLVGRWPRSLNLGFPNALDRALARTGSYILVHGGCSSVGCFAMTNAVVSEIYDLTEKALRRGQPSVPVHVFPFRMTDENLARHEESEWFDFWRNLQEGYDSFEDSRVPPRISVCDRRYIVTPATAEDWGAVPRHASGAKRNAGIAVDSACRSDAIVTSSISPPVAAAESSVSRRAEARPVLPVARQARVDTTEITRRRPTKRRVRVATEDGSDGGFKPLDPVRLLDDRYR